MKTLVTILAVFALSFGVNAQEIIKSIGNAAKNKAEQQDFNTTRSNKERNSLQNKKSSKAEEMPAPASAPAPVEGDSAATSTTMEAPASGTLNYKQEYVFEGKMSYEIEDLKKAKKNTMSYRYSNGAMATETPENNSVSIYDYENEVMIMFDEKAKSATVMSASWANKMAGKMADNHAEKVGKTTVVKTGNTKQILGYNCENYVATSEDGSKTDFWVTTELTVDNSKTIEAITKNMSIPQAEGDVPASGIMMEFTSYSKKGEAETHMIMTEYDKTEFTKKLADYRVTMISF